LKSLGVAFTQISYPLKNVGILMMHCLQVWWSSRKTSWGRWRL